MTFCKALLNLEGAYRVACSTIALIMRAGEGASVAEHAAGKILHGKAQADTTPKAAKYLSPPSPSLPTIWSNSPADDIPTTATGGE